MWVPLRSVAQALGAKVDYEPTNGVALLYHGDEVVTVKVNDANVDVSGTTHTLQAAPFVENGEAWVPVRFFQSVLGANVNVDIESRIVDINKTEVI
jgi:hypothetical protein